MVNPNRVAVHPPTRVRFDRVRADEILIVVMVLLVWAGAVYIFFNQWGRQGIDWAKQLVKGQLLNPRSDHVSPNLA